MNAENISNTPFRKRSKMPQDDLEGIYPHPDLKSSIATKCNPNADRFHSSTYPTFWSIFKKIITDTIKKGVLEIQKSCRPDFNGAYLSPLRAPRVSTSGWLRFHDADGYQVRVDLSFYDVILDDEWYRIAYAVHVLAKNDNELITYAVDVDTFHALEALEERGLL